MKLQPLSTEEHRVRVAYLHTAVHVPGLVMGTMQIDEAKAPGVVMTLTPMGLVLRKENVMAVVPIGNCKALLMV